MARTPKMHTEDELFDMSNDALFAHGRQRNIRAAVKSRMRKDELVDAILDRYDEINAELAAQSEPPNEEGAPDAVEPADTEPLEVDAAPGGPGDDPEDDEPDGDEDEEEAAAADPAEDALLGAPVQPVQATTVARGPRVRPGRAKATGAPARPHTPKPAPSPEPSAPGQDSSAKRMGAGITTARAKMPTQMVRSGRARRPGQGLQGPVED